MQCISLERLDFASANSLARTCPEAAAAWRRITRHEVADQTAALYRGLALRYAMSGMLRLDPLNAIITAVTEESDFMGETRSVSSAGGGNLGAAGLQGHVYHWNGVGGSESDSASESDGVSLGLRGNTLHPGNFFSLPPFPVNPALANDAHCLRVSVAFGFPLEAREVSMFRAFALTGNVPGVAGQQATLLLRGQDHPQGLVRPLFQFHSELCTILASLRHAIGGDRFFDAVKGAALGEEHACGTFPLRLSPFTTPEDGAAWHGEPVLRAAAALSIPASTFFRHYALPRAVREAAIKLEEGDSLDEHFAVVCQAFAAVVHGFTYSAGGPLKIPFQQTFSSVTGAPSGDRVLGLARRWLAHTGGGTVAVMPDPREAAVLGDAKVAYACATAFRKKTVAHGRDGEETSWTQSDFGPVGTHAGVAGLWDAVDALRKGRAKIASAAAALGNGSPVKCLFFPCLDVVLPAARRLALPATRVVCHNTRSRAVHVYVAETNKPFCVLYKRDRSFLIRWTRVAFDAFFDARVAALGTLRCRFLRALDANVLGSMVHEAVPSWRLRKGKFPHGNEPQRGEVEKIAGCPLRPAKRQKRLKL